MFNNNIKVALLGNSGVGKTCIISKYVDNHFDGYQASTICASYLEKVIKRGKNKYVLNIWDTAGQEKYQSLGKHFYKDAYIVLLVYDITNQKSLTSIKEVWYPDLETYGENCVVMAVVGNKSDLYEEDNLANEDEAKDFAKEIGAIFSLVSAKEGENLEKLFDKLLDKFLEKDVQEKVKKIEESKKLDNSFIIGNKMQDKKKCCK